MSDRVRPTSGLLRGGGQQRDAHGLAHLVLDLVGQIGVFAQELAQHGVALDSGTRATLRETELSRAQDVWARKYGQPPADAPERMRQMRFLAARGFSGDVVRQVVPKARTD